MSKRTWKRRAARLRECVAELEGATMRDELCGLFESHRKLVRFVYGILQRGYSVDTLSACASVAQRRNEHPDPILERCALAVVAELFNPSTPGTTDEPR